MNVNYGIAYFREITMESSQKTLVKQPPGCYQSQLVAC